MRASIRPRLAPIDRSGHSRRRSPLASTGIALIALASLTSCASTGGDAARVGNASLSRDDFDQLLDGYTEATQSGLLPTGNVDADIARLILGDWISSAVLERTLLEYGVELSDADLEDAAAVLDQQTGFAEAPQHVRDFYIRATALRTVTGTTFKPGPEELSELYAAGPKTSGVVCLRLILTKDRAAINDALERIDGGEPFGDVARAVSTDTSAMAGGVLVNSQTSAECFPYEEVLANIVEQIGAVIPDLRPGVTSEPIEVPDVGWVAVLLRPFSEVADEVEKISGPATASRLTDSALDSLSVWVSPEFGRWDSELRKVVPSE